MLRFLHICLITLPLVVLGQSATSTADHEEMGHKALANGLWEVAEAHFRNALETESLGSERKAEITVRLAESLLRAGDADQALQLVRGIPAESHPEASFWHAQALALKGHYLEAIGLFDKRIEDPRLPYQTESILSSVNLRSSFGQKESALRLLESVEIEPDSPKTVLAMLRRIEILLEQGQAELGRKLLPPIDDVPASLAIPSRVLEGRLLLSEGKSAGATKVFRSLLEQHQKNVSDIHELAALGLAESLTAGGKTQEALTFLIQFIQANPRAKHLPVFFGHLIPLLPPRQSIEDPAWQPVAAWSGTSPIPATGFIATSGTNSVGALPVETTPPSHPERAYHALFAEYIGWQRSTLPQAAQQCRHYANRLLAEAPDHELTQRLFLELAKQSIDQGHRNRALDWMDLIRPVTAGEELNGESLFLEGRIFWEQGRAKSAEERFLDAARTLDNRNSRDALFNASLIQLIQHREGSGEPDSPPPVTSPAIAADLAIEGALSAQDPKEQRALLEDFLTRYPDHARTSEARLAAADNALATYPPDLAFAKAQIETIKSLPEEKRPAREAILLREIRILDREGDSASVIKLASEALNRGPDGPDSSELMFLLGRNLYQTGNYNDARLALERLATLDQNPRQAQACWLLSARAASLVATQQSKLEAVGLFDKAIQIDGALTSIATLEKARLLIDLNQPGDAEKLLSDWFETLTPAHPAYLPTGFLLAESIRSQGTPEALESAMSIYDRLLEVAKESPSAFHRLQYLRGLTFEQMGDPETGIGKRVRRAFVAYYSVLETETPPSEWYYFELCGFKALSMLIESGRWQAAIACARRIASFDGPRASEADEIASQLQLKHMIWEDDQKAEPEAKTEE